MNRIKHCPVCGELVAVYQGDEGKYGDKAVWNYYQFIRLKYDCDECREMIDYLCAKRRTLQKDSDAQDAEDMAKAAARRIILSLSPASSGRTGTRLRL